MDFLYKCSNFNWLINLPAFNAEKILIFMKLSDGFENVVLLNVKKRLSFENQRLPDVCRR